MHKNVEEEISVHWIIGGASVAFIIVGGYLWFIYHQKKKTQQLGDFSEKRPVSRRITNTDALNIRQVPNWNNVFDMNYLKDVEKWLHPKSIKTLDREKAKSLAKRLRQAKGRFNDDEKTVVFIFSKALKDKTQVASLSKAFWQLYQKDLWEYLSSFLSRRELQKYVTTPVKKLPNYTLQ